MAQYRPEFFVPMNDTHLQNAHHREMSFEGAFDLIPEEDSSSTFGSPLSRGPRSKTRREFSRDFASLDSLDAGEVFAPKEEESAEYHAMYLQKEGSEFMVPVMFEDGMDYQECELYYASVESQYSGGKLRRLQPCVSRRASTGADLSDLNKPVMLRSCLRKSRFASGRKTRSRAPVRRCSFTGVPELADCSPPLMKSDSVRYMPPKPRVAFEEYIQVVTIHSVDDYPYDMREKLWMTRDEMVSSIRHAMAEDVIKKLLLKQKRLTTNDTAEEGVAERKASVDTVIAECLKAVGAEACAFEFLEHVERNPQETKSYSEYE